MVLHARQQRLAKAPLAEKPNKADTYTALVCQHTVQMLLPRISKRIDDLQYENYNIPTLVHGHRVLVMRESRGEMSSRGYEFDESDYVDARIVAEYTEEPQVFAEIQDASALNKLHKLIVQLEMILAGKNVSDKRMQAVMTAEEYAEYLASLDIVMHNSEIDYGDGMPSELKDYKAKLQKADFQNNKFEKMHGEKEFGKKNYTSATITKMSSRAESLYEDALERLGEIWSAASPAEQYELQKWMDREIDIDKGTDSTINAEAGGVPRVRGSKSGHALDSGLPKLSKRLKRKECQLQALRTAACAIAFEQHKQEEVATQESTDRIRDLLNKLKTRKY